MPRGPIARLLPSATPAQKTRGNGHFTARAPALDHIPTSEFPQPANARATLSPTPIPIHAAHTSQQHAMKAMGDGYAENNCEFRAPTCDLCRLLGVNKPKTTTFRAIYRVLDPFARKRDHKPVSGSCYFSWKRRLDPLVSAAGLTELRASG